MTPFLKTLGIDELTYLMFFVDTEGWARLLGCGQTELNVRLLRIKPDVLQISLTPSCIYALRMMQTFRQANPGLDTWPAHVSFEKRAASSQLAFYTHLIPLLAHCESFESMSSFSYELLEPWVLDSWGYGKTDQVSTLFNAGPCLHSNGRVTIEDCCDRTHAWDFIKFDLHQDRHVFDDYDMNHNNIVDVARDRIASGEFKSVALNMCMSHMTNALTNITSLSITLGRSWHDTCLSTWPQLISSMPNLITLCVNYDASHMRPNTSCLDNINNIGCTTWEANSRCHDNCLRLYGVNPTLANLTIRSSKTSFGINGLPPLPLLEHLVLEGPVFIYNTPRIKIQSANLILRSKYDALCVFDSWRFSKLEPLNEFTINGNPCSLEIRLAIDHWIAHEAGDSCDCRGNNPRSRLIQDFFGDLPPYPA